MMLALLAANSFTGSVIGLLVALIVIGFIVWLATTYVPMAPPFKTIIMVVGVVIALLLVLNHFGVWF